MHTPIADKKIIKDRLEMFLLDKFFKSVNPGPHFIRGRRKNPVIHMDELVDGSLNPNGTTNYDF